LECSVEFEKSQISTAKLNGVSALRKVMSPGDNDGDMSEGDDDSDLFEDA
jgi:hypothetical protein